MSTNPKYPVYIVSKGRWESRLTSKALEQMGVPYHVVVEPQEHDEYAAVIDPKKILVLPFSNLGQGSIPARNWVWEHAIEGGNKRHWILDDNIRWFSRLNRNKRTRVSSGATFRAIEGFVERYRNVAIAGMQYDMFVPSRQKQRPFTLNTRIYSCMLILNGLPHRWRGQYNEDTDLSLRVLKDGWCTVLFSAFPCFKVSTTVQMKGGNTDKLYKGDGRLKMAQSLQRQHPDVVRVARRFGRWQHVVDYRPFKKNKLMRDPKVKVAEGADEYGMIMRKRESTESLVEARRTIFYGESTPKVFQAAVPLTRKRKILGRLRPWAWWTEIVRGCNLRCGFCATRLFPKGKFEFTTMETWKQTIGIIRDVAPHSRMEIGNAGEPTLHPKLLDFLALAKATCRPTQLMLYTNGTTLIDGTLTYRDLFSAGLNMVCVDMYAPKESHLALAKESGYLVVDRDKKADNDINIFEYQNDPDVHAILLSSHPGNWPKRKIKRGARSTFFNNLDWDAAAKYGMKPVVEAPVRRCDLPSKFPTIYHDGAYTFCCFDFMREIAGTLGNVSDGLEGFFKYWLGEYMQNTRRLLHEKNRAAHPMCRRCAFVSIRADIPWWQPELLNHYWTGTTWVECAARTSTA